MLNTIYIRRKGKIVVSKEAGITPLGIVAAIQKNLESLGFLLGEDVLERLCATKPDKVHSLYKNLTKELQEMVGAHREFKPFYPNFPDQVLQTPEAELYLNAILHYITLKKPDTAKEERPSLEGYGNHRILRLGSREDFETIFPPLFQSKVVWSPEDKADVRWFVTQHRQDIARFLPEMIPNKENMAFLGGTLIREAPEFAVVLDRYIRTATDVLRLAVAMCDGDVSLTTACKFGKFRRHERALLLGWIERAANRSEDMLGWKPRWIRLAERLHPGEYASRFPLTASAFDLLRNDRKFETFNSRTEALLEAAKPLEAVEHLAARPGELARRLDHLVRIAPDPKSVVEAFSERAHSVSTPVLLQILTHFKYRNDGGNLRVFMPKGNVGKMYGLLGKAKTFPPEMDELLVVRIEQELIRRFAQLPKLGRCYVDPRMANYPIPFAMRSASKSLRTLVRGSRIPFPNVGTLRFFCWWKNGKSRVDIDLSAVLLGEEFQTISQVAYYNLKDFGGHHSGDIVDAPNGAAEFIDIGIPQCMERRVRYIAVCLNSFTQQPYCDLPECFVGWMARENPASGEVFEPKSVVDKVDVAADTKMCIPVIFDLLNREAIWTDLALSTMPRMANNVHNSMSGIALMVKAMAEWRKPDLFTLFSLHAKARGQWIAEEEQAETVFSPHEGITPFNQAQITSEFL